MTDTDRLADYFARLENPDHLRTLTDGCAGCGHSVVYCRCTCWITAEPCCSTCLHP